jgi:hypothetical protein
MNMDFFAYNPQFSLYLMFMNILNYFVCSSSLPILDPPYTSQSPPVLIRTNHLGVDGTYASKILGTKLCDKDKVLDGAAAVEASQAIIGHIFLLICVMVICFFAICCSGSYVAQQGKGYSSNNMGDGPEGIAVDTTSHNNVQIRCNGEKWGLQWYDSKSKAKQKNHASSFMYSTKEAAITDAGKPYLRSIK